MTADLSDAPASPAPAAAGPVRYRLATGGGRFRWSVDGTEVATAAWRDHCWDLRDSRRDEVALSLVGASYEGRTRIALVDHAARRTLAFTPCEPVSRASIGAVVDSDGAAIMLVKADGPTGLHVIDPGGEVLALTSRRRGGHGCDLLLLPAGARQGIPLMLGVTLALELLRAGALRSVA